MAEANVSLQAAFDDAWTPEIPNSRTSSGFLNSACERLGCRISGETVEEIVEDLLSHEAEWKSLRRGAEGLAEAVAYVRQGRLVIAAASGSDFSQAEIHAAIMLPKFAQRSDPFVYGGGPVSVRSRGDRTMRQIWNPAKHQSLRFFVHRRLMLGRFD